MCNQTFRNSLKRNWSVFECVAEWNDNPISSIPGIEPLRCVCNKSYPLLFSIFDDLGMVKIRFWLLEQNPLSIWFEVAHALQKKPLN